MVEAENKNFLIGFFLYLNEGDSEHLRGGILVVDRRGKPLEFRCTSPVKPTAIQRLLYGKSLLVPHVAIDLMGIPLVKSLRERPLALFVRDPQLLGLRTTVDLPVVHLRRQGESFELSSEDKPQGAEKPFVIESLSGQFQPVIATAHWKYESELDPLRAELSSFFAEADLLEPFERLANALKEIAHQKQLEA